LGRFESITFTNHALGRMRQRRITQLDVESIVQSGDGTFDDESGTWSFKGPSMQGRIIRVIAFDEGDSARVITAMRLRKAP
jgi:hypothetical protein